MVKRQENELMLDILFGGEGAYCKRRLDLSASGPRKTRGRDVNSWQGGCYRRRNTGTATTRFFDCFLAVPFASRPRFQSSVQRLSAAANRCNQRDHKLRLNAVKAQRGILIPQVAERVKTVVAEAVTSPSHSFNRRFFASHL